MAHKTWETIKVRYCHHVNADVGMEAQVIYPADFIPDQQPRIIGHRCSRAVSCNIDNRSSCIWAGTNPLFDPFIENK